MPTVATLPMWWQHGLPEEDGVFDERPTGMAGHSARTVAVVAYPRISNLDEFLPLKNLSGVRLRWARTPHELAGADVVILPGSKRTSGDLAWLRERHLDRAIVVHAAAGGAVLGICGGLQMLGERLVDLHCVDGETEGLGLLPVATTFEREKTVCRREAVFGTQAGAWAALSGVRMRGYEIHHGRTGFPGGDVDAAMPDGLAWRNASGNVLGLYLHGMFEDAAVLQAMFGADAPTLDDVFEGLADFVERHFEPSALAALVS